MSFIGKLEGSSSILPSYPKFKSVLLAWLGAFLTISVLALLTQGLSVVLILGSFGASCVLVFGFPRLPFSQPRNVIFGHVMSSFIGLACLSLFGPDWWSIALAVSTSIALMMLLRSVHPPAGSNPVIVFLTVPGWEFMLYPTLLGAVLVVIVGLLYNNLVHKENYPVYW